MNGSQVIFSALLIGIFSFCTAMYETLEECEIEGPANYCMTEERAEECSRTAFCEDFLREVICPTKPKVFCSMERTAKICGKVEFCSEWSSRQVKNVTTPKNTGESIRIGPKKIEEKPTEAESTETVWEAIARILGISSIRYRSRFGGYSGAFK